MKDKQTELKVKINKKDAYSYPIIIGNGIIEDAQKYVNICTKYNRLLIVTDENVFKLYPETLKLNNAEIFVIQSGEQNKNFYTYKTIIDKALEMRLERQDALVAFGGGIVGDITGFCAATYLRGIDFVQIPTTLLAQVDSSVGGKVGVNTAFGKNLVGAFCQPKLVIADTGLLETLDERQYKTGLAEVIKYAFIEKSAGCNYNLSKFLMQNSDKIKNRDSVILKQLIYMCCAIKASVVNKDERENGLRAILNLGHTFAHAIEKTTNYTYFTHGEAVAIGLKMAFELSWHKELVDAKYYNQALTLLETYEMNYKLPENVSKEALVTAMTFDKKVLNKKVRFVLPVKSGKVKITDNIEPQNSVY